MFDALARDVRHGVRGLLARPTYTLVCFVTLTLVVGAGSAVLAVINATLVQPLPLYVSHAQESPAGIPVSLVVRAAGDPLALVPSLRAAIFSLDPAQPIDKVTTLDAFLSASLGPDRFRSTLLLVFAGLGLLLAGVGIYGVTARSVEERTREVGLRLALGADPVRTWRLVALRAMTAVAVGISGGSVAALAMGALLVRLLPGLDRAQPWAALPGSGPGRNGPHRVGAAGAPRGPDRSAGCTAKRVIETTRAFLRGRARPDGQAAQ